MKGLILEEYTNLGWRLIINLSASMFQLIWWLRMDKWWDQEKVQKNLNFDSKEWWDTVKILDDPNISEAEKKQSFDKYINHLFETIGAKHRK